VLAVQSFERSDVGVGLVGDEALEAMPVQIGERELRAGMRTLATADQPRPIRPIGKVDLAGQLGRPRPVTRLAVLAYRRPPRRFIQRQQRLADRLGELVAEREADRCSRQASARS
jgi:hypothetical protein